MINKVILIGNLGQDPTIRALEGGTSVAQISVATNENYLNKNTNEWVTKTEWHDVVLWRQLAERAEKNLKKGMQVYVEGKLTHRKWQDKDGNDRYKTEVVANLFRILGKREDNAEFQASPSQSQAPSSADMPKASHTESAADEDDLPF